MLKQRIFYHQRIKYSFNWNLKNHKQKLDLSNSNRDDLIRLGTYLKTIYQGSIPNNLFNKKFVTRISQFKIKGLKNGFLRSFSKNLIRSGKITRLDKDTKLPTYAQKVYDIYHRNQFNKKPGHDPILKNILINDKDSIAIEVPIWEESNNKDLTGHIDLIQIQNNIIKVIDYKPEGNFMFSMPQVAAYGFLLKKNLNIKNLKCMTFNKAEAWEYDPNILLEDINNYLISQNVPRIWENFV